MTDDRPIPTTEAGRRVRAQVDAIRSTRAVRRNATNRDLNRRLADAIARADAAQDATRFGPPPTARMATDAAAKRDLPPWGSGPPPTARHAADFYAAATPMGAGLPVPARGWSAERRAATGLVAILVALVLLFAATALADRALGVEAGQASRVGVATSAPESADWSRVLAPDASVLVPQPLRQWSDFHAYSARTGRPYVQRIHGRADSSWGGGIVTLYGRRFTNWSARPVIVAAWREDWR